jgi:hypothetical protein
MLQYAISTHKLLDHRALKLNEIVIDESNNNRDHCGLKSNGRKWAGLQEDFYGVADWAHRLDPSRNKADAAWFVHRLLDDLQIRISSHFNQV